MYSRSWLNNKHNFSSFRCTKKKVENITKENKLYNKLEKKNFEYAANLRPTQRDMVLKSGRWLWFWRFQELPSPSRLWHPLRSKDSHRPSPNKLH